MLFLPSILKDKMLSCQNVSAFAAFQQHHLSVSNAENPTFVINIQHLLLFMMNPIQLTDEKEAMKCEHFYFILIESRLSCYQQR